MFAGGPEDAVVAAVAVATAWGEAAVELSVVEWNWSGPVVFVAALVKQASPPFEQVKEDRVVEIPEVFGLDLIVGS